MKKQCLIGLLFLASCASQGAAPHMAEQPPDSGKYRADLTACQDWAAPTQHEWAMRCEAQGEMVLVAHIVDSFGGNDPRDHDAARQSMPNSTAYRLDMCMKAKGYKVDPPADANKVASRY